MLQYKWYRSRPRARSKSFARSERLERNQLRVRRILPYRITPPVEVDATIRPQLQGKEYDEQADENASVQSRCEGVVVSQPPTEVVAPHEPLEEDSDKHK